MSSECVIAADEVSKVYLLYNKPIDRLKTLLRPGLSKLMPFIRGLQIQPITPEFWALHDVSLNIHRGETVGIVGQNGSGKSTLLQIICGTLASTSGSVEVNGRISAILELGTGFNPEFTGRENIKLSASIYGLSKSQLEAKIPLIVEFADIGIHIDQPVKTYSSGMYARLAFAVAIHVEPDILVVDEALAVGDEAFQRKCFARLEALKRSGVTILFVSHSGGTIVQLCDRAVLLHRGRKIFDGNPKQAIFFHQKISNAGHEREDEVLQEIKLRTIETSTFVENGTVFPESSTLGSFQNERKGSSGQEQDGIAFLDMSLKSESALVYDAAGAEIVKFSIQDTELRPVNVLAKRGRYTIVCDIDVQYPLRNTRFYAVIRTITGVDVAGSVYPSLGHDSLDMDAGSYGFEVEFECLLNPGTFFLSFALQAADGSLHHRIIDALPFRVTEEAERASTALVDLNVRVTHRRYTAEPNLEVSGER